jgi:hypothetical protein
MRKSRFSAEQIRTSPLPHLAWPRTATLFQMNYEIIGDIHVYLAQCWNA